MCLSIIIELKKLFADTILWYMCPIQALRNILESSVSFQRRGLLNTLEVIWNNEFFEKITADIDVRAAFSR